MLNLKFERVALVLLLLMIASVLFIGNSLGLKLQDGILWMMSLASTFALSCPVLWIMSYFFNDKKKTYM